MMVIGVDAHRAAHTAAGVNRQTAELLEQLTVDAREHGHQHLLDWARELDDDRVGPIEDARNLSGALERHLPGAGERLLRVPPKLMAMQRKSARDVLQVTIRSTRWPSRAPRSANPTCPRPPCRHRVAQLASYAGVAPLDASSGRQQRHRLNRTCNRQLNRTLHVIAVTQIRMHPPAMASRPSELDRGAHKPIVALPSIPRTCPSLDGRRGRSRA
jgi:hypothetical protein